MQVRNYGMQRKRALTELWEKLRKSALESKEKCMRACIPKYQKLHVKSLAKRARLRG
jgi:hypothetical protein